MEDARSHREGSILDLTAVRNARTPIMPSASSLNTSNSPPLFAVPRLSVPVRSSSCTCLPSLRCLCPCRLWQRFFLQLSLAHLRPSAPLAPSASQSSLHPIPGQQADPAASTWPIPSDGVQHFKLQQRAERLSRCRPASRGGEVEEADGGSEGDDAGGHEREGKAPDVRADGCW